MFPGESWYRVGKRDPRVVGLYRRHYSSLKNGKSVSALLSAGIVAPGESITMITADASALFVWLLQRHRFDGQAGVCCTVFRNEGAGLSSALILEAERVAWGRWPGARLFTYVDPGAVRSSNPGFCFKLAGWRLVRSVTGRPWISAKGLLLLEKVP